MSAASASPAGDDGPSRKAKKVAVEIRVPAAWAAKRQEIAAAILSKIGTTSMGSDGEIYVVAESVRRRIAAAILQHPDAELPGSIYLSLDELFSIPPCTIQRDSARHWQECIEKFSRVPLAQKTLVIAVLENGDIEVIEGNTRTYGWKNKLVAEVEIPEIVQVNVHYVKDHAAAKREYKTFNDPSDSKTGNAQLFSACRENGFVPNPDGFVHRGAGLVDALRRAFEIVAASGLVSKSMLRRATETPNLKKKCKPTLDECVKFFKPGLKALDALNPPSSLFKGAVARAFLLAYTKYVTNGFGDAKDAAKLIEFFIKYRDGIGVLTDGKSDAVQHFRDVSKRPGGGEEARRNKIPALLGDIERYIECGPNKMYSCDGNVDMSVYFRSRTALTKGNGGRKKK